MGKPIPFFSVIVPIYNVLPYLEECVDSILRQDFADFEVILVDDGSFDGSGECCDRYASRDARISVLHRTNGGLVSARKAGLAAAAGSYIVYVDGDDCIAPSYLSAFYQAAATEAPPVICCGYSLYRNGKKTAMPPAEHLIGRCEGSVLTSVKSTLLADWNADSLNLGSLPFSAWAKAFRADVLKRFQFSVPDSIVMGEDAALCVPLLQDVSSLAVIPECGYYYRVNDQSLSNTFRADDFEKSTLLLSYLTSALPVTYAKRLQLYAFYMYRRGVYSCCRSLSLHEAVRAVRKAAALPLAKCSLQAAYPYKDGINPLLKKLLDHNKIITACLLIKTVDFLKGRR